MSRRRLLMTAAPAALVMAGIGTCGVAQATGSPQLLVLNAVSEPVGDLLPGGTGAAQFTVTNPNEFGVRLVSVSFDRVVSSSNPQGCPVGLLSTHDQRPAAGLLVPASGSASFLLPGALTLSTEANDACLGVTFIVRTRAEGVADSGGVEVPPTSDLPGTGTPPDGSHPGTGVVVPGGNGHGITDAGSSGRNRLAFTGVPVLMLVATALALMAAGVVLWVLGTRHHRRGARR